MEESKIINEEVTVVEEEKIVETPVAEEPVAEEAEDLLWREQIKKRK